MSARRIRLDELLVERGLFESRSKAKAAVLAGLVRVEGELVTKAGAGVPPSARIEVEQAPSFVSRGGMKLLHAWETFRFDVEGRVCLDCGASTGGFTDFLLAHGASLVYAVDVGYGQLSWRLREDPRVVVMERTNIRHLVPSMLKHGSPSLFTLDLSFISLRLVLPVVASLCSPGGGSEVIALVKPQFEAGRDRVGKGGVIRDPKVHEDVLCSLIAFALEIGYDVAGCTWSRVPGPAGNLEFFLRLLSGEPGSKEGGVPGGSGSWGGSVERVVAQAHQWYSSLTSRGSS